MQWLTAPYAIAADAVSYLWSALWLAAIGRREPAPERVAGARLVPDVREGLVFVARHPILRAITACTATSNLFSSAGQAMLIVLLARNLHLSAGVIGALMSAGAVGGAIGALIARRLAGAIGEGRVIWLSVAVAAPLTLVQPFLHRNWTLAVFVVTQIVVWAGIVIYNVTQVSFRQALCPEPLLGRMNAAVRFFIWGSCRWVVCSAAYLAR